MKRLKGTILSLGLVGMLAVGPITALANSSDSEYGKGFEVINGEARTGVTTGEKDGGYWIRGKRSGYLISEYKHYTKEGHASVVNGLGEYVSGGWKPAGEFSVAKVRWTVSGTNKAYYDYR